MALQYRIFTVPCTEEEGPTEQLNTFLRSVRAVQVHRESHLKDGVLMQTFVVEYFDGAKHGGGDARKIDYKQVLSAEDFAIFSGLRELRKTISEERKVQLYVVATNEQLAEMARRRPDSRAALSKVEGFGQARMQKDGDRILSWFAEHASP